MRPQHIQTSRPQNCLCRETQPTKCTSRFYQSNSISSNRRAYSNKPPFDLTPKEVAGRDKLDLATPLDFVSTGDIIGGNSGSPVVNRDGELVGLIFDGNIESMAGDFVYDGSKNRAVAVHSAGMIEGLRKLYGAGALADELEGKR